MKILPGDKVGSHGITFLADAGKDKNKNRLAKFRCHCGEEFIGLRSAVLANRRKSCRCLLSRGRKKIEERTDPDPEPWNRLLRLNFLRKPLYSC